MTNDKIINFVGNYYGCSKDEETHQYDTDSYDFQSGCYIGDRWLCINAIGNCIERFFDNHSHRKEVTTSEIINAIGNYFGCSKDEDTGEYDKQSYDFQSGCYIRGSQWLNLESAIECMEDCIEELGIYVERE